MWGSAGQRLQGSYRAFERVRTRACSSPMPQTALIVDDHPGFRTAARSLLEADGFDVVGESATGGEGLAAGERLRPDLVLLDVCLPEIDGIKVSPRIPTGGGRVVVLTPSRDASVSPPHFCHCGARGFIPKA